ncbi:MAG: RagB/SusD family nutrient uptake outer membrane protein, partial [Muribaculaceae bacterium]|nr:RagB/SusD family nutrient uptake outer membrane protein [Muribaculaceae bacterium]
TLYNNRSDATSAADYTKNNSWEHGIRPSNALGGGGKVPSAMMVDLFPMKDGRKPASCGTYYKLDASASTYNEELPFLDRDPRFYRTFAFPGVRWAFSGDPTGEANHNRYKGDAYELWNYVWYTKAEDRDNIEGSNKYGPDGLMANAKGMYVRKRSDDLDVNGSPRYAFMASTGFKYSASPLMEIRYAEVLLNYAEAACGAGHMGEAVEQLQKIRRRVGYTGDCGLQADLAGDQAACMSAVLYERQIELAYEGKRFDDMRRWMLFDGGAVPVPGAPTSWTLTGWGGNTCTWLGVAPLNGKRRENLEFRVKANHNNGLGGSEYTVNGADPDPLANVERCAAVDLRKPLDEQLQILAQWYGDNIERNKKKGDSYDSNHTELFINYQPYYYIVGLTQGAQIANQGLPQNIGWADFNNGGAPGTFDPLAE